MTERTAVASARVKCPMGPVWILFPLSLGLWARAAAVPAALYLLTSTLAVGALMFLPPVAAVLEPRLGYLLMRFPWLLPASAAVGTLGSTASRSLPVTASARSFPAWIFGSGVCGRSNITWMRPPSRSVSAWEAPL